MATTALVLLLLGTLVALGRPPGPLTTWCLPRAALRGVLVLSRLSDRRRRRLAGGGDRLSAHAAAPAAPQPPAVRGVRTPC